MHGEKSYAERITLSLPAKSLKFIERYRREHSLKSPAEVIEIALATLEESEREADLAGEPERDDLGDLELPASEGAETDDR